jgi:hypothetical protein
MNAKTIGEWLTQTTTQHGIAALILIFGTYLDGTVSLHTAIVGAVYAVYLMIAPDKTGAIPPAK